MDSNTHSTPPPEPPPGADGLAWLVAGAAKLAAEARERRPGSVLAAQAMQLRRVLDGLEGQWLQLLATVDACGAAGADQGEDVASTAAWLRQRRRMSLSAATGMVRTARALFSGALPETAAALCAGKISPAHAKLIADGTHQLPDHVKLEAEPVLLEAARRVDPPRLRQAVEHLVQAADPERAEDQAEWRHARRGVWLSPTWEGMVAIDGLLEPEAGNTLLAALEPLAKPAGAGDDRNGRQRNADALAELARRSLEGGWLPKAGGVRPQLLVTVDLDSLLGRPEAVGGEVGLAGPLDREACRRLACDGSVTRVLVSRQPDPTGQLHPGDQAAHDPAAGRGPGPGDDGPAADPGPGGPVGLQQRLRAAAALLPPVLGGAPRQPLEVGRATRVVAPAQRAALVVRDGGCVFPGCDRPLAWCEAHHLWHWTDGGPTNLANLAMVCRAHHRTVHEEGWRLIRGPDGRFTVTPTRRRHHTVA